MAETPDILFIVLDSVRYDRTTLAGHHRDTTPNLQKISTESESTSFEFAISHARYTPASSASILTGTHPDKHQVGIETRYLSNDIPTVPGVVGKVGYNTVCVSNNPWVSPDTGLSRGFDDFTLKPNSISGILRTAGLGPTCRWLANLREHSAGFTAEKSRHSTAYLTSSLVKQKIDEFESKSNSLFLYAHFDQPHRPYHPPLNWLNTYADDFDMSLHEASDFIMDVHHNLEEYVANDCPFSEDEKIVLKSLYDAQLKYTDDVIGRLIEYFRSRFDNSIVVVTSDHGEHLGEHGALAHKYVLDDCLLRVPLVVSGGDFPSSENPVQHSDVIRTLLEQVGAKATFVDGVDLRKEERKFAISYDAGRSLDSLIDINPEFEADKFLPGADEYLPARFVLRTMDYRYVRTEEGKNVLYSVSNGDEEIATEEETVSELDEKFEKWRKDREFPRKVFEDKPLQDSTRDRLRDLGYLDEDM